MSQLRGKPPRALVGPDARLRHVLRIALRRAGVDPSDDRVDLVVGQRPIVLEMLDADRPVDVPRRHLPRRHARLDGACPRARLFVGDERHRRDRVRPMTRLTFLLEDRRDVLGERHRRGVGGQGRAMVGRGERRDPARLIGRSTSPGQKRGNSHGAISSMRISVDFTSCASRDTPNSSGPRAQQKSLGPL